jgi:hypothetical protein
VLSAVADVFVITAQYCRQADMLNKHINFHEVFHGGINPYVKKIRFECRTPPPTLFMGDLQPCCCNEAGCAMMEGYW